MSNMVVRTNVMALNSHRSLKTVGTAQSKASSRLSSGYKINSAADDAAGLAISEKMRAQIRGLDQASTNAQDAISLIQTAEGGMQEIDNMVQRIRELVVKASNDTNDQSTITDSSGDRQKIQDEIDQLTAEIDSMSERVEFNQKKLIDGSLASGGAAGSSAPPADVLNAKQDLANTVDLLLADISDSTGTLGALVKGINDLFGSVTDGTEDAAEVGIQKGLNQLTSLVESMKNASSAGDVMNIYSKITSLFDATGQLGQYGTDGANESTTFKTVIDALAGNVLDMSAGSIAGFLGDGTDATAIIGAAKAYGTELSKAGATAGAGTLYFQIGANAEQGMTLNIESVKSDTLGIGDGNGGSSINVMQTTGDGTLTNYLDTLDSALTHVTRERSKLGAAQNRLEYTIKSLDISSENLSAAESRVRDTDMAKEMMNFTQANVLQQAATSMLAQANSAPQSVLQLLQ